MFEDAGVPNASVAERTDLPASLMIMADKCQCRFVGLCSCGQATSFMNCIADKLTSGDCESNEQTFVTHCHSMAAVCPSIGLTCGKEQATCINTPIHIEESNTELRQQLHILRERRCKLQDAARSGYLNAKHRLRDLEPVIQSKLDALQAKGVGSEHLPHMGCGPAPKVRRGASPMDEVKTDGRRLARRALRREAGATGARKVEALIAELEKDFDAPQKSNEVDVGLFIAWAVLLIVCAAIYDNKRDRQLFKPHDKAELEESTHLQNTGWYHPLFGCLADVQLSLFACCCPVLRWADSIDKLQSKTANSNSADKPWHQQGFLKYWHTIGIAIFVGALYVAGKAAWNSSLWELLLLVPLGVGVFYRQRMRRFMASKYGPSPKVSWRETLAALLEDILAWTCCSCCAIAQEARQVDAEVF